MQSSAMLPHSALASVSGSGWRAAPYRVNFINLIWKRQFHESLSPTPREWDRELTAWPLKMVEETWASIVREASRITPRLLTFDVGTNGTPSRTGSQNLACMTELWSRLPWTNLSPPPQVSQSSTSPRQMGEGNGIAHSGGFLLQGIPIPPNFRYWMYGSWT